MPDEAMRRLLDYDRRRYWLANGWSIRFRISEVEATPERPHGIKYALTLHDGDGMRLPGFDTRTQFMTIGIASGAPESWWLTISGARMN
ncbi:MAG TPA: hypothetical protein VJ770_27730 [Stellaceae bacterium]|nr:hypothetical protein [Stellaceae bacterium]